MSADTTVVMLMTKGPEFRIELVQAAENLTSHGDVIVHEDDELNMAYALLLFADCEVITDYAAALREAHRLHEECEYVEYGVREMRFPDIMFPEGTREDGENLVNAMFESLPGAVFF